MALWADGTGEDASTSRFAAEEEGLAVDDEDEYEEAEGGNRLLGFMFGNVDGAGDLDVDYLDESILFEKQSRVGLANILETIVETLKARTELSYLFLKPVTRKEAPDYLDFVDRPMDLSTIRDKTRRMEYKSREDFRHDVHQIAFNAHAYNDRRNPDIPPLADQLLELCDFLIGEYDTALKEAESGIE